MIHFSVAFLTAREAVCKRRALTEIKLLGLQSRLFESCAAILYACKGELRHPACCGRFTDCFFLFSATSSLKASVCSSRACSALSRSSSRIVVCCSPCNRSGAAIALVRSTRDLDADTRLTDLRGLGARFASWDCFALNVVILLFYAAPVAGSLDSLHSYCMSSWSCFVAIAIHSKRLRHVYNACQLPFEGLVRCTLRQAPMAEILTS